jgi:hypothetical protein
MDSNRGYYLLWLDETLARSVSFLKKILEHYHSLREEAKILQTNLPNLATAQVL